MFQSLYQLFFENSSDAMMITNSEHQILLVNQAFSDMTGHTEAEVLGKTPSFLVSNLHVSTFFQNITEQLFQNGNWQGEIWNQRKDGRVIPCWHSSNARVDESGQITHYISVFRNIAELKKTEADLRMLADYDPLTGLLNRRALEKRLDEEISAARRSGRIGACLYLDLDDFKKVNDSLGHKAGDRLLIKIADRIGKRLRKEDVFARISGDEFVILISDLPAQLDTAAQATARVIKNLLETLKFPFRIEGHVLYVSASFGATFFHPFAQTPEDALMQADTAMYAAKKAGKNSHSFYHPVMQETAKFRLQFESELREAIRGDQLCMAYQPQYNHLRELIGYEALVRWQHPQKGLIPPVDFINLAEDTGIIIELGKKIMQIACRQLNDWIRQGKNVPRLSINVSPSQFNHEHFVNDVLEIFRETEIDPRKITLEITENLIFNNIENVIAKMQILKQWGVRFAIDDFGTGYSSLAYLKKLPIDQLKIDKSFVQDIHQHPNDVVIVNTILSMAKNLQLEIIAEGVENQAQLDYLLQYDCKGFQGYLFGRPLPVQDIH